MKTNTHPKWNSEATVTCACGATFNTGSVIEAISVDICSQCHPFFTGEMKFVDVQGRVEKFQARQQAAQKFQATNQQKKTTAKPKREERPQTLREMLQKEKQRLSNQEPNKQ